MLWTMAVSLLILWLMTTIPGHTLGGFIHFLLVLAMIAVLNRLVHGRNLVLHPRAHRWPQEKTWRRQIPPRLGGHGRGKMCR